MKYKAILFDMDGTLLPMDNNVFVKGYFKELAKKLSPVGLEPDKLIESVWAGTKAMVKNDGARRNSEVFWDVFNQLTGKEVAPFRDASDWFYSNEFANAKVYTEENPLAVEAVKLAHKAAEKVVCATNPLFPMNGQQMRLSWVGLKDTDFDLVTSYESDSFCKPNPEYYRTVCERIGVQPNECLHVGNDEREDAFAASSIGMDCYIVTDNVIPCEEHPWNGRKGTFAELVEYLRELSE